MKLSTKQKIENYAKNRGFLIAIGHPKEWNATSQFAPINRKRLYSYSSFSNFYDCWQEPTTYFYSLSELKKHLTEVLNQ